MRGALESPRKICKIMIHLSFCIDKNFWFVFEHTETLVSPQLPRSLALYQGPLFFKCFFLSKDADGKYLLFAILGSYLAYFGAKEFKFL